MAVTIQYAMTGQCECNILFSDIIILLSSNINFDVFVNILLSTDINFNIFGNLRMTYY